MKSIFVPSKWVRPVTNLNLVLGRSLSNVGSTASEHSHCDRRLHESGDLYNVGTKSYFAELPLDRAANVRKDVERIRTLQREPGSRTVLFCGNKAVVKEVNANTNANANVDSVVNYSLALWHPEGDAALLRGLGMDETIGFIFLGLAHDMGHALFACMVTDEKALSNTFDSRMRLIDVRTQAQFMSRPEASILALASGLLSFNRKTKYSPVSGNPLVPIDGGHARQEKKSLSGANALIYPRLDPAVIVGVTYCQEWLLLGRKSSWVQGRYSLLAGFAEIGETLEGAVVREVEEEAGVKINPASIRYCGSQPWPFPQSLMIGFVAEAGRTESGELPKVEVDNDELEDARWFHRSWLQKAIIQTNKDLRKRPFMIPGPYAIAHHIIWDWVSLENAQSCEQCVEIPDVAIEMKEGAIFKYILVRVTLDCGTQSRTKSKLLVRGDSRAEYHDHILQATKRELAKFDAAHGDSHVEVLGGGRMQVFSKCLEKENDLSIKIYGYSAAFGQAPHSVTAEILRRVDPFLEVEVSYEGY
jgi:NADH pyrophosphatase NudC (nudix superfamily)